MLAGKLFFIRESLPQFENRIMARCMQGALRVVLYTKKLHFVSRNWLWKISSVACGFSSIKIDFSDCPKSLISRINEVYGVFFNKNIAIFKKTKKHALHLSRLFCCNHTCYCVKMVPMTSASRNITSASRYHPCYQSRSS